MSLFVCFFILYKITKSHSTTRCFEKLHKALNTQSLIGLFPVWSFVIVQDSTGSEGYFLHFKYSNIYNINLILTKLFTYIHTSFFIFYFIFFFFPFVCFKQFSDSTLYAPHCYVKYINTCLVPIIGFCLSQSSNIHIALHIFFFSDLFLSMESNTCVLSKCAVLLEY